MAVAECRFDADLEHVCTKHDMTQQHAASSLPARSLRSGDPRGTPPVRQCRPRSASVLPSRGLCVCPCQSELLVCVAAHSARAMRSAEHLSVTGAVTRLATTDRSPPRRQPKDALQYDQLDILAGFGCPPRASTRAADAARSKLPKARSIRKQEAALTGSYPPVIMRLPRSRGQANASSHLVCRAGSVLAQRSANIGGSRRSGSPSPVREHSARHTRRGWHTSRRRRRAWLSRGHAAGSPVRGERQWKQRRSPRPDGTAPR